MDRLNLSFETLLDFAIGDFQTAWDAMANTPPTPGRSSGGNFMFALMGMVLLELACRGCASDNAALDEFGATLNKKDPRYFKTLPGPAEFSGPSGAPMVTIPDVEQRKHLLACLFDLIRNGQGHQYQQAGARLAGGRIFAIKLTGVTPNLKLEDAATANRLTHLMPIANEDIWLTFCPDVFFCDVRDAIQDASLRGRGLVIRHIDRNHLETVSADALRKILVAMQPRCATEPPGKSGGTASDNATIDTITGAE